MGGFTVAFFSSLLCSVFLATGQSVGAGCQLESVKGPLDMAVSFPLSLADYQPLEIIVSPQNLNRGESYSVSVEGAEEILWLSINDGVIRGRAPLTMDSTLIDLTVNVTTSEGRQVSQEIQIPVTYENVAAQFSTFRRELDFNPSDDLQAKLQTENYAVWDIMPWIRTERKAIPAGTYCYPTPDQCTEEDGTSIPGFLPSAIQGGDFDGDGDEDVLFVAEVGSRTFKSLGSEEDMSYWTSVHILLNDGSGRLSEGSSRYEEGEAPRMPSAYRVEVADFNGDGIDDAFVASFGVPYLMEDNTNFWAPYPHLLLLSQGDKHVVRRILQNEPGLNDNPETEIAFAHDAGSGDLDGDGNIDVLMNAVIYFGDGEGDFSPINLNQTVSADENGFQRKTKVNKTHAHASAVGDFNGDEIDDIAIFWTQLATPENEWGAKTLTSVALGPFNKNEPKYLDSADWVELPIPYYGFSNTNYNDAFSGDINGDGFDDLVVGSTRKDPYYAGRHVQILVSNGDGTFEDETAARFSVQPRAELDQSLVGIGIGEGVIQLIDLDRDGDLDIVDTQGNYGGPNFAIYPRVTLALNNGYGVFEEVASDFFPLRMDQAYFDATLGNGLDGEELIQRSGVVDLDGQGWLDFVSHLTIWRDISTAEDSEPKWESALTSQSFISKRAAGE